MTLAEYRNWAELRIDALNHALKGLPQERIRYHICWGSWNAPHVFDVPLRDIIDLLLKLRVGGYQFEAANVRHEHEWKVWQDVKVPEDRVLIPGVISHVTNVVEHPELVADRLIRYAEYRRPRKSDGRLGLRLCTRSFHSQSASDHSMGEAEGPGRGRQDRDREIVGADVRYFLRWKKFCK